MALCSPATGFFISFAEAGASLNGFCCACIIATARSSHKTTKLHVRSFQAIGVLATQFVPLDYPMLPAMRHPALATVSNSEIQSDWIRGGRDQPGTLWNKSGLRAARATARGSWRFERM